MILGTYKWQEVNGVVTPEGESCWRCPNCDGDQHICGMETMYSFHHKCKECNTKLVYPWEEIWEEINNLEI